jgi:RNA polymerase sigma-70 factor (ECF subfamily)
MDGTASAWRREKVGSAVKDRGRFDRGRSEAESPWSCAILVSAAESTAPPPEGVTMRDLVVRARNGDHDAFAELAGAAISRLDATAWLMLRDSDRAMDAVQNTLVRAWRDLPALRDPDRFDAWLHRLLMHACIDEIRRGRRIRFDVDVTDAMNQPHIADSTSAIADRDQLERGFRRLEPEERAVIVLHHYLDLPLTEVAATLRIPLGTAKSRLYRGMRDMRAALDADARPGPDIREGRPA